MVADDRAELSEGNRTWELQLDEVFTRSNLHRNRQGNEREIFAQPLFTIASSLEHKYSRKKRETFKELDVMLTTTERHNWKYVDRKVHKAIKESDVNTI